MSEKAKPAPTPHERFAAALASTLKASPEDIKRAKAAAKAVPPSPHTRYTADAAKADS